MQSTRKTVWIVTQSHPSLNPRVVKEADALASAGYTTRVVAPVYSKWGLRADEQMNGRKWEYAERPRYGPGSPAGTRCAELIRRSAAASLVKLMGIRNAWAVYAAWHPAATLLMRAAAKVSADLYIAHYPAALPAAAAAAKRWSAKYAFDAEDFHPGDLPNIPRHQQSKRLLHSIESTFLPGASYVTAAAPLIAEAYAMHYGIDLPTTVLNTFSLEDAPPSWSERGSVQPRPSLYWFSQTIGPDRGLETAVEAIAMADSRPHLYLRGLPQPGYLDKLMALAARHGVRDRVRILDIEKPSRMVLLAAEYDIGLGTEVGQTVNRRIALTNKVFTYLLAGVPALLSDIPAHRDLQRSLGSASKLFSVGDAQAMAARIDEWLLNPEALRAARHAAWRLGQERYNWEYEAARLRDCVTSALEPDPSSPLGGAKCTPQNP